MASRFEVVEEICRNGRAALYRARDTESAQTIVLRRYFGTATELELLGNALARIASLDHPNLERFIEVGEDDEGLFAIVEAPRGRSLTEMLSRGPLTVAEFEQVASQLLAALVALHEAGYPHLALRPEVVRVNTDSAGELEARLTGFGEGFGQPADENQLDVGAYRCCAPEHWRGEPIGRRTDVYALGCVLYEALAGRPAFQGASAEAMRSAHLEHDVTPLDRVAPHAPRWIAAWVMHLIEPAAEERLKNGMQARELYEQREAGLAVTADSLAPVPAPISPPPPVYPYPQPDVASPRVHPGTAEIRSARATSTAVPVVIEAQPALRAQAGPRRPQVPSVPSIPPAKPRRSNEELRVLFSMIAAGLLITAIVAYMLVTRQKAKSEERAADTVMSLPVSAGLVLQLDADRAETVFREPRSGRIRRWKNGIGKPPHLEQSDSNAMPALIARGLAGKSTLDFGSLNSGQWMQFTDDDGEPANLTTIRTVFWVLKGANFLFGDDDTTHFHRGDPDGSTTAAIFRGPEAATMSVRLNGVPTANAATTRLPDAYSLISAVASKPLEASRLCRDRAEAGRTGGQQIAEILVYDRPLAAQEIERVELYLRRKWFPAQP